MTRGSARSKAASLGLLVLGAATIVLYLVVVRAQPTPGTVELALARDGSSAQDIVQAWRATGTGDDARRAVLLDFALIPLYAAAIGWGCVRARRVYRGEMLGSIGMPLAYAMPGVAALDIAENLGLLRMISSGVSPAVHAATTTAAWIKFAVFGLAYAYAVVALATWAVRKVSESGVKRVPFLRRFEGQTTVGQIDTPDPLERSDYHMPEPPWREGEWTPPNGERRIGICCSGGGVRSAAYNLGALQVLREEGIFERARYLSAVSGGAYIAAAFAMTQAESDPALIDAQPEFARGAPEEEYLRNRSSYLAPGLRGKARAALQAVLGLAINVVFFWIVLFVAARPAGWLISSDLLHPELRGTAPLRSAPTMLAPIALTAALAIGCALWPMLLRVKRQATSDKILRAGAFLAVVSGLLLVALVALPWLTRAVPRWLRWLPDQRPAPGAAGGTTGSVTNAVWLLQTLGIGTMAAGAVRSLFASKRSLLILLAGGLVAPLLAIMTFVLFAGSAARSGPQGAVRMFGRPVGREWVWFAVAAVVLFVFYRISDQTTWSMHPFYKRRLCSAFALRRVKRPGGRVAAQPLTYDALQSLSRYRPRCWYTPHVCHTGKPHECVRPDDCAHDCRTWPELVICAAANVSDEGATPPGRNAVSFTFTSSDIGGPRIGWIQADDMEKALGPRRVRDITMPAAVAISGAAISPAMGKMTRRPIGPLVALANLRLGVWLPHPLWVKELRSRTTQDWIDRPRVIYLLKEIFGRYRLNDRFLYVTDGGHWENLGLVELLRRGCTEIYCFDASGDDVDTFFTLGEAVALARTELGVEIEIDPEPMKPPSDQAPAGGDGTESPTAPRAPVDHVAGTFTYPNGVKGHIVFAKAAVTAGAPWDVRAYADFDARFPTHSTLDQLYTDKKFEAYRALGAFAARNSVARMAKETRPRDRAGKLHVGTAARRRPARSGR